MGWEETEKNEVSFVNFEVLPMIDEYVPECESRQSGNRPRRGQYFLSGRKMFRKIANWYLFFSNH